LNLPAINEEKGDSPHAKLLESNEKVRSHPMNLYLNPSSPRDRYRENFVSNIYREQ
jgi:hypothetical protein